MRTKCIARKEVYKGKIITVTEDTIQFANGTTATWELVLHNGAAAIVPLTENEEVILVEQYRNAEDGLVLEIPAGKLEKDEDPLDCAFREIEEEIGYKAGSMDKICEMYAAIGFSNEKLHLYVARDLLRTKQKLDEDEFIDIKRMPLNEAVDMIFEGKIKDSKTICGLLAVQKLIQG